MSTLNSPVSRIPLSPSPTSSRRTSVDTSRSSPARAPLQGQAPPARRNRAALRDYYNLKATAGQADASSSGAQQQQEEPEREKESELDRAGFEAEKYVTELLGKEGLEGILKVEGDLVNQIKFLDGERKALVYDNYSKLITATDTIKRMRANMDPLTPTTSTLAPAVAHIAATAEGLAQKLQPRGTEEERKEASAREEKAKGDLATVKWVLGAPGRFKSMDRQDAEAEWVTVKALLDKWEGVEGVEKVREECTKALEDVEVSEEDES